MTCLQFTVWNVINKLQVNSNGGAEESEDQESSQRALVVGRSHNNCQTVKDLQEALAECKTTKLKRGWLLQMDKDPKHNANSTRDQLKV